MSAPEKGSPVDARERALRTADRVAAEYERQTGHALSPHVLVEALGASDLLPVVAPVPVDAEGMSSTADAAATTLPVDAEGERERRQATKDLHEVAGFLRVCRGTEAAEMYEAYAHACERAADLLVARSTPTDEPGNPIVRQKAAELAERGFQRVNEPLATPTGGAEPEQYDYAGRPIRQPQIFSVEGHEILVTTSPLSAGRWSPEERKRLEEIRRRATKYADDDPTWAERPVGFQLAIDDRAFLLARLEAPTNQGASGEGET